MKKVLIVGGGSTSYVNLVKNAGFVELATSYEEADILMFTGGHDVNPELYGEKRHPNTMINKLRDEQEVYMFNKAKADGKKFVGICRGGQFLNVMNGGRMFQHVNGHSSMHNMVTHHGDVIKVTSTHHQMMRPAYDGQLLGYARESHKREFMKGDRITTEYAKHKDPEVVFYPKTNSLCFQPHPEFTCDGVDECREYFYELLEDLLC